MALPVIRKNGSFGLGRKISSPKALFTFEVAARHLSFTSAAVELNVTAPAVSRMIASLESHLEMTLFVRRGSKLSLTENGTIFKTAVTQSFQHLESVIDQLASNSRTDSQISLSVTTTLLNYWLMPRLAEFRQTFPEVSLQYELTRTEAKDTIGPCDIGSRFETEVQPEDQSWNFAPELIFALATPQYLQRHGSWDDPSSDHQHTLLSLFKPRITWQIFSDKTGLVLPKNYQTISVPDYSSAVQLALSGGGVFLGFVSACSRLMLDEMLVPVTQKQLRTGRQFVLVASAKNPLNPTKQRVCDWLLAQMQDEIALIEKKFAPHQS